MKSIQHILDVHGIKNPALAEELETVIKGRIETAFERGVDEGRASQAITEVRARDQFIETVRANLKAARADSSVTRGRAKESDG